jgi:pimeloyl-ACP methyl ester carboxylesterase
MEYSIIGHSFGGALGLRLVARDAGPIREVIFADTLAACREWRLAEEATHPTHFLRMASPRAALDFFHSWIAHPMRLMRAGLWAFTDDRGPEASIIAEHGISAHVLWADRDSLLARQDGEAFAKDLNGTFTVAHSHAREPLDHNWMFRHPSLFVEHLDKLELKAFRSRDRASTWGKDEPTDEAIGSAKRTARSIS